MMIDKETLGVYVRVNNEEEYRKEVVSFMRSPWLFSFVGNTIPKFDEVKKHYHGNSKILIHAYFNRITKEHELQITTRATEKSCPSIPRNFKVYNARELGYDDCIRIFGDPEEGNRFIPIIRTGVDGRRWWCVWDRKRHEFSKYTIHGKYKTLKDAEIAIARGYREMNII